MNGESPGFIWTIKSFRMIQYSLMLQLIMPFN